MQYHNASTTKKELAAALKQLMEQKPLEKISIREITSLCGLRRETFYYHFADIYALIQWMFEEEALALLRQHEGVQFWREGLLQLFRYIQDNRAFCLCAFQSIGHSHLRKLFQESISGIVRTTVDKLAVELHCPADELVVQFYTIALVGTVESWLLAAGRGRPHAGGTHPVCRHHAPGPHAGHPPADADGTRQVSTPLL